MWPEKPSKRSKISEDISRCQNMSWLAILPDELFLEDLSYYPNSKPKLSEYSG